RVNRGHDGIQHVSACLEFEPVSALDQLAASGKQCQAGQQLRRLTMELAGLQGAVIGRSAKCVLLRSRRRALRLTEFSSAQGAKRDRERERATRWRESHWTRPR